MKIYDYVASTRESELKGEVGKVRTLFLEAREAEKLSYRGMYEIMRGIYQVNAQNPFKREGVSKTSVHTYVVGKILRDMGQVWTNGTK